MGLVLLKRNNMSETRIIRIDSQGFNELGCKETNVYDYVENLGFNIIKSKYSSFGACYFFEIEVDVRIFSNPIMNLLEEKPKDFNWSI